MRAVKNEEEVVVETIKSKRVINQKYQIFGRKGILRE